jgi:undecaprenyl diphosphate synthase
MDMLTPNTRRIEASRMVENNLPNHVAIVPDGNRRWAAMKGVPRIEGHRLGAARMHEVIDEMIRRKVKYLTVWGFSCDNWNRSQEEVTDIFNLLRIWIEKDAPWLHENGVRLKHIGDPFGLPQVLQDVIIKAIDLTKGNSGMTLNLAVNYSGREDILDAVHRIITEDVPRSSVDESLFNSHLYTCGMPDVDLVIRTADEFRISNFMLWQTAYAEFVFTPVFWPDFDAMELEKALNVYADRKKRHGGD